MPSEYRIHLHLYGIANCDSCRSARKWLATRNVQVPAEQRQGEVVKERAVVEQKVAPHPQAVPRELQVVQGEVAVALANGVQAQASDRIEYAFQHKTVSF